jgi:hypothetical protein
MVDDEFKNVFLSIIYIIVNILLNNIKLAEHCYKKTHLVYKVLASGHVTLMMLSECLDGDGKGYSRNK